MFFHINGYITSFSISSLNFSSNWYRSLLSRIHRAILIQCALSVSLISIRTLLTPRDIDILSLVFAFLFFNIEDWVELYSIKRDQKSYRAACERFKVLSLDFIFPFLIKSFGISTISNLGAGKESPIR